MPPPPGLPLDAGVIVQNVATCAAVYDAVVLGKPLYERVVTVTGQGIREPKNLIIRNGSMIADILEFCGGLSDKSKVILGGPMMGLALTDLAVPVLKSSSGILTLSKSADTSVASSRACIRCGSCVRACPLFIVPSEAAQLVKNKKWDGFLAKGGMACIECGCCAYSCPSRIPLVQYIRIGKAEVNARQKRG